MKSKSKYRKRIRRVGAKMKKILANSKKAFTRPKGCADPRYVLFEESTGKYFSSNRVEGVEPYSDRLGRWFWVSNEIDNATKFSKNSCGINDVIPFMRWGAWRIIKIKNNE